MEVLLQDIILFGDQQKAPPEIVKIWLQLLHNCLAEAKYLLHRSGRRQRCVDCIVSNPRRPSKQVRDWKAFFNHLCRRFQIEVIKNVDLSRCAIKSHMVEPVMELLNEVINKLDDSRQILKSDLRRTESLVQDSATLCRDISILFPSQLTVPLVTWWQLLQTSVAEVKGLLDRPEPRQSCLGCVVHNPSRLSKEVREWNIKFDRLYHGFQNDLSMSVTSLQFLSSKPLMYKLEDAAASGFVGSGIMDAEPLSRDEGWMLFRRLAFKDNPIPMDIQERALRFAEECMGVPLAIKLVAAMIGQTPLDEWDTCFSLLQKNNIHVDPSFPAAHPRLLDAPQLYTLLRWTYDALPNSNVKKCFLYCAIMYKENQVIESRQLVEMWIGEGLVKQETHSMNMAIGRKYLKLLIDRCFFHIVKQRNVFRQRGAAVDDVFCSIRVHHALIREMAVYIAQKEENCLLMGSQNLRNFPEAHYENCRRISFPDGDLPTDLRCPNLSSLILQGNRHVKELLSQFLLSLTSLRVLNLSGCTGITSVPSSVGQLRLLQFLSLSELPIKALPKEVCHLSELQFLDLSRCMSLDSLPSQIGQLRNLKHLNLYFCDSLKMIPRQIYELTSLSRLQLWTDLSVEMKAPASIWSLKGLKSLTELKIWIDTEQQDGKRSRIKDGIMGTWSEMRHLVLRYHFSYEDDLLPEDMQNMKKLQSFMLFCYSGSSLPNCKFDHLEMVKLCYCHGITELCPLERLPNLKILKLEWCDNLRELGMGSPGGYVSLQRLVLKTLFKLERLDGASRSGEVWDERTLPQLRVLKIGYDCPILQSLPRGMEKLQNLCAIISSRKWWERIVWNDDNMKANLQQIFRPST